MTEIIFIYEGKEIILICNNKEENFEEIYKKFSLKIDKDINNFIFLFNDHEINKELTPIKFIEDNDYKNNKIIIQVKLRDKPFINNNNDEYIKSKKNVDDNDKLIAKYKINKNQKIIKIFGASFVKNNKKFCKIVYEGKEYELIENFEIYNKNKDILEIELIGISYISDINNLFSGCSSLVSLSNISNMITSKIKSMQSLFNGCLSLLSLPDISKWDISNVTNISFLFNDCRSLSLIPDISEWNTINIKDMSFLFNGCTSLTVLPDISKWNFSNLIFKDMMFSNCYSLSYIPYIFEINSKDNYVYSLIGPIHIDTTIYDCINNINNINMYSNNYSDKNNIQLII